MSLDGDQKMGHAEAEALKCGENSKMWYAVLHKDHVRRLRAEGA